MTTKIAILIDGGYLRTAASSTYVYNPDFIEKVARRVVLPDETLQRIFYYDCDPFNGEVKLPVSGELKKFEMRGWLDILAMKDLFAVRKGTLKFRGFKPKKIPVSSDTLTDADFKPYFEQKGVDMRIGLDIATLASSGRIERIVLVTGDTDCVPAMKHGRIAGLQVAIVRFPGQSLSRELLWHADFCRSIEWPEDAEKFDKKT
ncbi:NYN domain-containing protein [Rhizobium panacihumi]|uniref:NYN domain-containing protein n=1 Tax=Rhizobium panacihumi TaxID=2008450 RepID=UPI003D7AEB60